MPRLVFLNRFFAPDASATSQMLTDLAVYLASRGFDVRVVTSRQRIDDPDARLPARERIDGVDVIRLPTTRFGRAWLPGRVLDYVSFYLAAFVEIVFALRRGDVLVAKTDPPLIGVVAALCAGVKGARLVNWIQDLYPEVAGELGVLVPGGRVFSALARLRNWSLRRAQGNVVISAGMAARLRESGIAASTMTVIPNWADGRAISPRPTDGHPLRLEWGLQGKFVVGYSGNMGRAHDFESLMGAAAALGDDPDIRFLLIGSGIRRDELQARIRDLDLGNVVLRPFVERERLGLSLTVPDVHVVSLRPALEGLIVPSKVYGIAAAGRPMLFIGSPGGEVAGLIAAWGCGAVVAPGDVPALVDVVRHWRASPQDVECAGQQARALFESGYDRSRTAADWEALLRGVSS